MLLPRILRVPRSASLLASTKRLTLSLSKPQSTKPLLPPRHPHLIINQQPIMALHMQGRCVCKKLQYSLDLESADAARTTLCHCHSCRRAFGTNYGLTAKVPLEAFRYESGTPKKFKQHNGVTREFCDECGAYICEYGEEAADKFRYIVWGSLDEPDKIPPKGEFFCKSRAAWMPEIPGAFQKREIKE